MCDEQELIPDKEYYTIEEAEALMAQYYPPDDDEELTDEQQQLVEEAFEYKYHAADFDYDDEPILAARYGQKMVDVLERANLGNHRIMLKAYGDLGRYYYLAHNYDLANRYLLLALEGYQSRPKRDFSYIGLIYTLLGHTYCDQQQYAIAIEFYKEALEAYRAEEICLMIACTQNRIGRCYSRLEEYDEAIYYFTQTVEMPAEVPDERIIAYSQLGSIYCNLERIEEMTECYHSAIAVAEQKYGAESFDVANVYNQLAIRYNHLRQMDNAIEYYQRALTILSTQRDEYERKYVEILESLGLAYIEVGQVGNGLDALSQVLDILRELDGEDDPHIAEIEEFMTDLDLSYRPNPQDVRPS